MTMVSPCGEVPSHIGTEAGNGHDSSGETMKRPAVSEKATGSLRKIARRRLHDTLHKKVEDTCSRVVQPCNTRCCRHDTLRFTETLSPLYWNGRALNLKQTCWLVTSIP